MLLSVDDTPFGRAFGQFLLRFNRPGLDVAQAHAAFADLSALAAREHPDMAWPVALHEADGASFRLTVEGLLADKWARYADWPRVDAASVAAALTPWTGAAVRSAQAGRGPQGSAHLHLELRTPAGALQWLTARCPWQVVPARAAPLHWDDPALDNAAAKFRRARVQRVGVEPTGTLRVRFANGAELVVGSAGWQPNAEVADLHYSLQTEEGLLLRVADQFLMQTLDLGERDLPVSLW